MKRLNFSSTLPQHFLNYAGHSKLNHVTQYHGSTPEKAVIFSEPVNRFFIFLILNTSTQPIEDAGNKEAW